MFAKEFLWFTFWLSDRHLLGILFIQSKRFHSEFRTPNGMGSFETFNFKSKPVHRFLRCDAQSWRYSSNSSNSSGNNNNKKKTKLNEIIQDIANLCLCMVKGNHAVLLLEWIQMKKK